MSNLPRVLVRRSVPKGFTLIELLVSVSIISILALAALPHLRRGVVQAKVSASRNNQRVLSDALEVYRLDHGDYPCPVSSMQDAYGVVAHAALHSLTTPVAYVSAAAFRDPFGLVQLQVAQSAAFQAGLESDDPFRPPTPQFNAEQSLLYYYYPRIAFILDRPAMARRAYAVVSVGPDLRDSFIVYYPFPDALPGTAAGYGIESLLDTIYDPTNGVVSGGDLAAFGGHPAVPRFLGGGR